MTSASQPVVLCGKTEQIGQGVINGLKPEFDVIHFIITLEAANTQIPLLLQGKEAPSESKLGSHDYSRPPMAVLLGGAFTEDMIETMKGHAGEHGKKVPWMRPDETKPAPPLGPEYGKAMVRRIKEAIGQMQQKGDMKAGETVWF